MVGSNKDWKKEREQDRARKREREREREREEGRNVTIPKRASFDWPRGRPGQLTAEYCLRYSGIKQPLIMTLGKPSGNRVNKGQTNWMRQIPVNWDDPERISPSLSLSLSLSARGSCNFYIMKRDTARLGRRRSGCCKRLRCLSSRRSEVSPRSLTLAMTSDHG